MQISEHNVNKTFSISASYKINQECYFDDNSNTDEWQKEVYQYALNICLEHKHKTVIDFGCGSGFKLINLFNDYNTVGIDLPETVEILKLKYPNKIWKTGLIPTKCDIFIASDVIEHMQDPDILIDFIKECEPKDIILSTPDRDLTVKNWGYDKNGPPGNVFHVREWNMQEFNSYISESFNVISHRITNEQQCTQMIHASLKK